ncbi:unnamed protein product [Rotaria sp. Silwood2]|nr:unnamed protein product [Rotaria sp. Silwood2]
MTASWLGNRQAYIALGDKVSEKYKINIGLPQGKPLDTVVHTINDKLVSPLEILKRRCVPVHRLLQHNQQKIHSTVQIIQQRSDLNHNDDHHYHGNHAEIMSRVDDFNRQQTKDDAKLCSMLKEGHAYTQIKFIQQEHVKD